MSLLCRSRVPVIVCERRLPDGNWLDLLGQISLLPSPPRLIVTAANADEALWTEVLNMGGYDVLMKPLDGDEVRRVLMLACEEWESERAVPATRCMTAAG